VEQHGSTDEVEAEEHWQRYNNVNGHTGLGDGLAVRVDRRPVEVKVARDGVDGTYGELGADLGDDPPGHGNAPVIDAVIDDK